MSEKRFHQFGLWVIDDPNLKINTVADLFDTKIMSIEEVVDLLNEQQSEINSLKMELELISGEKLFSRRELERKVDEQQATIERLERKLELKTEEVEYLKRMMVKWGMVKDE